MKIVQMQSANGTNGAATQSLLMSRELAARGHEVTLFARKTSWIAKQIKQDASIQFIPCGFRRWHLQGLRDMARWLEEEAIDVIHTHSTSAQVYGVFLKLFSPVPVVAAAHHSRFQPHWAFNDYVIANSEVTRKRHRLWNRVPAKRIETVWYPINHRSLGPDAAEIGQKWREHFGAKPEDRLIGLIGTINPRKNQAMLVRSLPRILTKVPHARVVFLGTSEADYRAIVQREIERLGVGSHIHFAGFQDDIPGIMQALDLLVACPTNEPFGLTVPEAMAAGLPTVATRVGGLRESIVDGQTGYLVSPRDVTGLADAIIRVLADPAHAAELGAQGRQRFLELFDIQKSMDRHVEIFRMVCQRTGRRSRKSQESRKVAA
ncbi:MAG: glycosyltransferase family 4 protein [Pirellulaceae bacterium]